MSPKVHECSQDQPNDLSQRHILPNRSSHSGVKIISMSLEMHDFCKLLATEFAFNWGAWHNFLEMLNPDMFCDVSVRGKLLCTLWNVQIWLPQADKTKQRPMIFHCRSNSRLKRAFFLIDCVGRLIFQLGICTGILWSFFPRQTTRVSLLKLGVFGYCINCFSSSKHLFFYRRARQRKEAVDQALLRKRNIARAF